MKPIRRTKIIATIGPASKTPRMLAGLIAAGVDAFRINMSHTPAAELADRVHLVRRLAAEAQRTIAIIVDLAGAKVRLGEISGGSLDLAKGAAFRLTRDAAVGDASRAGTTYDGLIDDVEPGALLLVDDGRVQLRVDAKNEDELTCTVLVGGTLASRKGISAPGSALGIESLTQKDRTDLAAALEVEADWIAASFVRRAGDIDALRELVGERKVPLIAKIERAEAVDAIDEIVAAADGVMIARGDLGVELPSEDVPVLQKQVVAKAVAAQKPVITATQMLESMIRDSRPTRAEASDVANAVFDGSDALMLSGETAIGAR